ncbi:MFS transporter like protein [Zymoseptoria brevis]|uniref:MFS transporter like protein n=1 Tax=Zymoseptoria brevis TaxID=1047168 RepID=A0A0F4G7C8_9PEZI|nr:MFS transporter like protein [Zymoseptoria brevis]
MAYQPVATLDDQPESRIPSSQSSTSARFTPDFDSDDEEDGRGLEDVEDEEGYELNEIRHGQQGDEGDSLGGADEEEDEHSDDGADVPLAGQRRRRRRRTERVQSFELYTPDEEKRVRRKLDIRLVLFVAMLYMVSFLDRTNIGNANVAGLSTSLRLSTSQFEWLLRAFYISYVLFEWMTICYTLFPPHVYIASCVFFWGLLACLQSFATSFAFLLILRVLLGIAEAAFVGMPIYLSFFFRRDELALRTGMFIAAAPLASTFSGFLAYAIMRFGDILPISNWRVLFFLEGAPALLVAIVAWYWLPDRPSTTRWLIARERKVAALRMRSETTTKSATHSIPWSTILSPLLNPLSYLPALMFFACNVAFSSMPVFMPLILTDMGFPPLTSQALTAPPYLFAFLAILLTAYLSDRHRTRTVPMVFHALLAMSGYTLLSLARTLHLGVWTRYACVFPICAGFFSCVTVVITWTVNNQRTAAEKGTGVGILQFVGQLGPFVGTGLYPKQDGPYFERGMVVCAVCMLCVAGLAGGYCWMLKKENRRRQANSKNGFVYIT